MRHAPILIAILFFIPCAHAGERIEFYSKHINVVSSNESVEVGEEGEPGHVLAFFAASGVGTLRRSRERLVRPETWRRRPPRQRRH